MPQSKRKFKSCPDCNSRGKPVETEYDEAFICTEDLCNTIYYGDDV